MASSSTFESVLQGIRFSNNARVSLKSHFYCMVAARMQVHGASCEQKDELMRTAGKTPDLQLKMMISQMGMLSPTSWLKSSSMLSRMYETKSKSCLVPM